MAGRLNCDLFLFQIVPCDKTLGLQGSGENYAPRDRSILSGQFISRKGERRALETEYLKVCPSSPYIPSGYTVILARLDKDSFTLNKALL